jgi:anti-sigma B factor antagonist
VPPVPDGVAREPDRDAGEPGQAERRRNRMPPRRPSRPTRVGGYRIDRMMEIRVTRAGTIDVVQVVGEVDLSNVGELDDALREALADDTTSCLLDLSQLSFLDSSVVQCLLRWHAEAQLSAREALAVTTGAGTPALRLLTLTGVVQALPLFTSADAARTALLEGQRARGQRRLQWLTDAELATERSDAQAASDAATRRLDDIGAEESRRESSESEVES